jgi:porin
MLEQKVWVDCCNKNRTIGFFGHISVADKRTSQYEWTMNASLQAQGLLFGRDQDTMGIGYFYSGLSGDFKALLGAGGVAFADLQGAEFYYNAAVTPWFHLTGDLQVIQPGMVANDTAVVAGLRANLRF